MKATQIAVTEAQKIASAVNYLQRMLADEEARHERAADAVSYLCAEVQRFLDDPERSTAGYDALAAARQMVLSMYSGDFSSALGNPLPEASGAH